MTGGRLDFERINKAALADLPRLLADWFPEGRQFGREFKVGDLYGSPGDSLSVNVDTGQWADFAAGESGGDPISLYAAMEKLSQYDAAKALAEITGENGVAVPRSAPAKPKAQPKPKWTPIMPVPECAPAASFRHGIHGEASRVWTYLDGDGRLLGYVCRFDMPDGGKEVIPLTRCTNGKTSKWWWQSFPKPRPLYGLELLTARPKAQVVICEGEKAADAARELLPQAVVVSWPGGGKAVKHADWSPLAGRKIVIWPDWDRQPYPDKHARAGELMPPLEQPGIKTALAIAAELDGIAAGVRIAFPKAGENAGAELADGWDAADALAEGWTSDRAVAWLKGALLTAEELRERLDATPPAEEPPPYDDADMPPPDYAPDYGPDMGPEPDALPFSSLGFDRGTFYYLPRNARQVIEIPGRSHGPTSLLMLAPLHWWQRNYPSNNATKPDWTAAANALFRMAEKVGPYDPRRVRGRGAWWDDGVPVLHLGDRLVINGDEKPLDHVHGRYVYEVKAPMRAALNDPLPAIEAHKLAELCKMLPWEKPISALLLSGFCVVAPICGALRWRPHVWITGPAGSGKSWVFEHIVRRALGDTALTAQSATTEAGIRQILENDARPVVFDEAEAEDDRGKTRMKSVLDLMRQASSENSAPIIKGSATGRALDYRIRSSFALASILDGMDGFADQSRVSILSLVIDHGCSMEERQRRFAELRRVWHEVMTEDYVQRLQARAIQLIPVIRQNAETFAVASGRLIGSQRLGDQIGTLIAGAYALHSNRAATLEEAEEWVSRQDWSEQKALNERRDEIACLQRIMEHVVRVQGVDRQVDVSIGELVARAAGGYHPDVPAEAADQALLRYGIKLEPGILLISNNASAIGRMLGNTPWTKNWGTILRRLDGAVAAKPTRFGPGVQSRAVAIPLESVIDRA